MSQIRVESGACHRRPNNPQGLQVISPRRDVPRTLFAPAVFLRVVVVSDFLSSRIMAHYKLAFSMLGGGCGISSFVPPDNILEKAMPTPSMTASRTAQPMALLRAALKPPRKAREPPTKKPAIMALYGSSFLRMPLMAQSYVEKRPPQTPKLPPRTGARILMAVMAPIRRSP
uniref:Uncharacterized protein n=1 Tax=Photinus pyralis TaxID=7054 RepID=A0A1Y1KW08_PHOPY